MTPGMLPGRDAEIVIRNNKWPWPSHVNAGPTCIQHLTQAFAWLVALASSSLLNSVNEARKIGSTITPKKLLYNYLYKCIFTQLGHTSYCLFVTLSKILHPHRYTPSPTRWAISSRLAVSTKLNQKKTRNLWTTN